MSRPTQRNPYSQTNSPDLAVAIRAASQWGVLDVAELRACGLSRPRDRAPSQTRHAPPHPPGRLLRHRPPLSMHARFLAATKATNGVLSHYSAAVLWRLVHYDPDGPVHVTVSTTAHAQSPGRHRPPHPSRAPSHPPGRHPRHHPGTRPDRPLLDAVVHPTPPRCPRRLRAEASDARGATRPDQAPRRGPRPGLRPHRIRTRGRHPRPDPRPLPATPGPTDPDPRRHPDPPDFRWPDLKLCVEADGAQCHDTCSPARTTPPNRLASRPTANASSA